MPPPPTSEDDRHEHLRALISTGLVEPLPRDLADQVDAHLASCVLCREHRESLRGVASLLTPATPLPPGLEDRIVSAATASTASRAVEGWHHLSARLARPTSGQSFLPALGAGICALLIVAVVVLTGRGDVIPAGTLGATEVVDVTGITGVSADAAVVAHTWGTEVQLRIEGLTDQRPHRVILRVDGTDVDAGSFLGTDVTITCRMTAAILRADVDALVILSPDGTPVLEGPLDPV